MIIRHLFAMLAAQFSLQRVLQLVLLSLASTIVIGCAGNQMQLDRTTGQSLQLAKDAQRLTGRSAESIVNGRASSKELEPSTRDYLSGKSTDSQNKAGNDSNFKIQSN